MMSRSTAYRAAKKLEENLQGLGVNARPIVVDLPEGGCAALGVVILGIGERGIRSQVYLALNPHYAFLVASAPGMPIVDLS